MTPPKDLAILRVKAEGKLIILGCGVQGDPLGIFTTIDGALWAMRHYQPYEEKRWWWLQFWERDIVDKKGERKHTLKDSVVRWVFGVKKEV